MNYIYVILSLMFSFSLLGQNQLSNKKDFSTHQGKIFSIKYPTLWKTQIPDDKHFITYLTDTKTQFSSPGFVLTIQSSSTAGNLELEYEKAQMFKNPQHTITKDSIKNIRAYKINNPGNSHNGNVDNIWYHAYVSPTAKATIQISGYTRDIQKQWDVLRVMINSIEFYSENIPTFDKKLTEVSLEVLEKNWTVEKHDFYKEKTKLDVELQKLNTGVFTLKIKNSDIVISDWNTFFKWKPSSTLKNYQIFSHDLFEAIDIFNKYVQLSSYDNLLITQLDSSNLQFDFIKNSKECIRWIINYSENNPFILNEKIPLNQFLFTKVKEFRQKNGKLGYNMKFHLNEEIYAVKVNSIEVY